MRKILVLGNIIRNDSVQEMTIYVALELSIHIFFILGVTRGLKGNNKYLYKSISICSIE